MLEWRDGDVFILFAERKLQMEKREDFSLVV